MGSGELLDQQAAQRPGKVGPVLLPVVLERRRLAAADRVAAHLAVLPGLAARLVDVVAEVQTEVDVLGREVRQRGEVPIGELAARHQREP